MQGFLKSRTSPRTLRLLLLAGALVGSAIVSAPPRAEALTCPPGSVRYSVTTYYTDASYSTVACVEGDCNDSYCDPTPYYRNSSRCCPAAN